MKQDFFNQMRSYNLFLLNLQMKDFCVTMSKRGAHIRQFAKSVIIAALIPFIGVACSDDSAKSTPTATTAVSHADAYDALLRSEETYLTSDTPNYTNEDIAILESYYLTSDSHEERAHALFFCAQHSYDKGNTAEALLRLIEAEKSTQISLDKVYEGRIRRMMGDIYGEECLFKNALNEYSISKQCFIEAGLDTHALYADYDIGVTHLHARSFREAERCLKGVLERAAEEGLLGLYYGALQHLIDVAIYLEKYDECKNYIALYDESHIDHYNVEHKLYAEAIIAAHNGDIAAAEQILGNISPEVVAYNIEDYYHTYYIVYRIAGDNDKAIKWLEQGKTHQDRLIMEVLNQPTLNIEVELLQSRLDAERNERLLIDKNRAQELKHAEIEREHLRTRNILTITIITVIFLLILAYVRHRWQRRNRDIEQYVETIQELQMASRDLPEKMNSIITEIYRDRFSELNELCEIYYDHNGTTRQKNLVFNQLCSTIDAIKSDERRLTDMEEAVNRYRNDLMVRLREQVGKLSERDIRVALYIFAGFSSRAISIFMDSDPVTVSKMRYNIKQKIKNSNAEDMELLLQAISEK